MNEFKGTIRFKCLTLLHACIDERDKEEVTRPNGNKEYFYFFSVFFLGIADVSPILTRLNSHLWKHGTSAVRREPRFIMRKKFLLT